MANEQTGDGVTAPDNTGQAAAAAAAAPDNTGQAATSEEAGTVDYQGKYVQGLEDYKKLQSHSTQSDQALAEVNDFYNANPDVLEIVKERQAKAAGAATLAPNSAGNTFELETDDIDPALKKNLESIQTNIDKRFNKIEEDKQAESRQQIASKKYNDALIKDPRLKEDKFLEQVYKVMRDRNIHDIEAAVLWVDKENGTLKEAFAKEDNAIRDKGHTATTEAPGMNSGSVSSGGAKLSWFNPKDREAMRAKIDQDLAAKE